MSDQTIERPTAVTKMTASKSKENHPTMSFTAVMSHQGMAEAFVNELTRIAGKIIPDHDITPTDIYAICQLALAEKLENSITMVGGRHLRARITEQVSRSKRYQEPFSLIVLKMEDIEDPDDYESVVDTLRERMRQTDLLFLFKVRIVILLPHTDKQACNMLVSRIHTLIEECLDELPSVDINDLTYPHSKIATASEVLDWTENQLRTF